MFSSVQKLTQEHLLHKVGNLTERKLLAAILWLLNSVVIMTKLWRIEMKAKSTNHEGGSNKNHKPYFPPDIVENIVIANP